MPEGPEVETVRRILKEFLINKTITNVNVVKPKLIKEPNLELFKKLIINEKINDISRVGKNLIFEFNKYVLISHLRMEGKYLFR